MIGGRYHPVTKLSQSNFGTVFSATELGKGEPTVALKIEQKRQGLDPAYLSVERTVYAALAGTQHCPKLIEYGECDSSRFLVLELLGRNLDDLHYMCHDRFSLKTVLMIIDQTLTAIETLHSRGFIYRDIKPSNFMIGRGDASSTIYMADYGLAKPFRDESGNHIPFSEDAGAAGTSRYCSARAMLGHEVSRRDDMEALGYMWISFIRPLPWSGICNERMTESHKRCAIHAVKSDTSPEVLCVDLPREFQTYFSRVKDLKFEEEPPYAEFREMFRKLFVRFRFVYDHQFDWSAMLGPQPKATKPRAKKKEKSLVCERLCPLSSGERMLGKARETRVYARPSEMWDKALEPRKRKLARGISCSASLSTLDTLPNLSDQEPAQPRISTKFTGSMPENLLLASVKRANQALLLGAKRKQGAACEASPLCSPEPMEPVEKLPGLLQECPVIPPPVTPEDGEKLPNLDFPSVHRRIKLGNIRKP